MNILTQEAKKKQAAVKLTVEDVENIRTLYGECKLTCRQCWKLYKNRISLSAFEKIFQGKYKTKLVLILNPIVALVVFGLRILGKKFSDVDSFVEKILPENLNISELILCIALFIGSIVSYLKICDFKCIKR